MCVNNSQRCVVTTTNITLNTMEWIEIDHKQERTVQKVFCDHRGGLEESLDTTIYCPNGIDDIKRHLEDRRYVVKFRIVDEPQEDDRLPDVWGKKNYPVHGIFTDGSRGVIGWCNFLE